MKTLVFIAWMCFVVLMIPVVLLVLLFFTAKAVIEEILMEETWPD